MAAIRRRFFAGLFLVGLMSPAWAGSVAYTYDTLGRITKATYSTGVVIAYVYDAAGNRSSYVISGAPS
jgi:YD repeat-containing protein